MTALLLHSPAVIIARLIIQLGLGIDPVPESITDWQVFETSEPDRPDNTITVYATTGVKAGRTQIDGEVQGPKGAQVRVRSATHDPGYVKANAIATAFDESVEYAQVTIDNVAYIVQSITRPTPDVLTLGQLPGQKRYVFTVNALCFIRKL